MVINRKNIKGLPLIRLSKWNQIRGKMDENLISHPCEIAIARFDKGFVCCIQEIKYEQLSDAYGNMSVAKRKIGQPLYFKLTKDCKL